MTRLLALALSLGFLPLPLQAQGSRQVVDARVEFLSGNGQVVSAPSGTVQLWTCASGRWTAIEAAVDEGRFRVELPDTKVPIIVGRAVLDGREAWCPVGLRRPGGRTRYALSLRETCPATLQIVDTEGADVVEAEIRRIDTPCRTGDTTWTRVTSPYSIPLWFAPDAASELSGMWIGERTYDVRAPGKARRTIHVDPRFGGTHVIVLEPEARLDITFDGPPVAGDAVYQLVIDDGSIDDHVGTLVFTNDVRDLRVDGLRAAQYVITPSPLESIGRPIPDELVAGRFSLTAGETRSITLRRGAPLSSTDADGREPGVARELRGKLHVPAAWKTAQITIELQRRDPVSGSYRVENYATNVQPDPIEPELHRWSASDVPDGMWRAVVRPIPWYGSFELGPGGPRDVQLAIPSPIPITVGVVDGRSGTGVDSARVSWHACSSDHAQDLQGVAVAKDTKWGSYAFDATESDIVVRVEADGYETAHEHLRVLPRGYPNAHTVTLLPSVSSVPWVPQRIRVVAYEREGAGGLVPAIDFRVRGVPVHSSTSAPISLVSKGVTWIAVEQPGTYDVHVEPSADFETPAPVRVVVTSDFAPAVRVRLARK